MFFDKFKELCESRNKSVSAVATEIGLSNSTPTKWKRTGAIPEGATLAKIADYFGVSTGYLLEKDEAVRPFDTDQLSPAFFRLKQGLEPYNISPADADFLIDVYKAHIKKNQQE